MDERREPLAREYGARGAHHDTTQLADRLLMPRCLGGLTQPDRVVEVMCQLDRAWLGQARYQQSIINAITRPAEGKPWRDYRPIFLTEKRIDQGRVFLAQNRADDVAAGSGARANGRRK